MKADPVFFIVITLVIIALAIGSESVRLMMAGALALGAVPLWTSIRRKLISEGIARAAKFIRGQRESS